MLRRGSGPSPGTCVRPLRASTALFMLHSLPMSTFSEERPVNHPANHLCPFKKYSSFGRLLRAGIRGGCFVGEMLLTSGAISVARRGKDSQVRTASASSISTPAASRTSLNSPLLHPLVRLKPPCGDKCVQYAYSTLSKGFL